MRKVLTGLFLLIFAYSNGQIINDWYDSTSFHGGVNIGSNLTIPTNASSGYVLTSDADGLATWQHLPTSFIYMFSEDTSTISGYYQAVELPSFAEGNLKTKATAGVSTTPTLLEEFATAQLDAFTIPSGTIHFHIESQKTAGSNNYYLYFVRSFYTDS